ncbi:MAG: hypothetical protein M1837_001074 [Sclerophora amabilis]|nr:MAG: hypothetical protein M1837_001074 [Sclerophora amabilis]
MGGNSSAGTSSSAPLTVQRALDIARTSEQGHLDPAVTQVLERAISDIWRRVQANPTSYVFTRDEFAVFNYFRLRYVNNPTADAAVERFWDNYRELALRLPKRIKSSLDPSWSCKGSLETTLFDLRSIAGFETLGVDSVAASIRLVMDPSRHSSLVNDCINLSGGSSDPSALIEGPNQNLVGAKEVHGLDDRLCLPSVGWNPEEHPQPGWKVSSSILLSNVYAPRLLRFLAFAITSIALFLFINLGNCDSNYYSQTFERVLSAEVSPASPLEVFQVHEPVLIASGPGVERIVSKGSKDDINPASDDNDDGHPCTELLMAYSFANSYGNPYVGPYDPPSCPFNQVTINLTVTSQGRQFDRLGLVYLGDVEVFRTSTAEPTSSGIHWTYIKDMSNYLTLFKSPQKVIFDLGNLIDGTYTAPFNITLTATFLNDVNAVIAADVIVPISARRSATNKPSAFTIPADNATDIVSFPRNIRRAVFTISACGQADEEFWWSNVLSSNTETFASTSGSLYGFSPFRELQLFIDGNLAGVAWPFAIIFTGGVAPGLWRPIVGIDAFDLREREVDISPWLPILCDGGHHAFEIRVVGIDDNGQGYATLSESVGNSWVVSGKVFIWLDAEGAVTTGTHTASVDPPPLLSISSSLTTNLSGANDTLSYEIRASRQLSVSSTITTSNGTRAASWTQSIDFDCSGVLTHEGFGQATDQTTKGVDVSSSGYASSYYFPLSVNTTFATDPTSGNFSIDASINRGLNLQTHGNPVFPTGLQWFESLPELKLHVRSFTGTTLHTTQNASAQYLSAPASQISFSFGSTEQEFFFGGLRTPSAGTLGTSPTPGGLEIYRRHVLASNGTVVEDDESLVGNSFGPNTFPAASVEAAKFFDHEFAASSVRDVLGRGSLLGNAAESLID